MAKKNSVAGHPAKNPAAPPAVSVWKHLADKAVSALEPAFEQWFLGKGGSPAQVDGLLLVATATVAEMGGRLGCANATEFNAAGIGVAFERLEPTLGDAFPALVANFHVFIDFLDETGRWSGSEEDFEAVHELVDPEGHCTPPGPVFRVPATGEAEALRAMEETRLMGYVRALLEWVGTGRAVTGTGSLRLADLGAAAACIGVSALSHKLRPAEGEGFLPGLDIPGTGDLPEGTLYVRTIRDIPLLNRLWQLLLAAGALRIDDGRVVPGEHPSVYLEGAESARYLACRSLLAGFLSRWLADAARNGPLGPDGTEIHLNAFSAGTGSEPITLESLIFTAPDADRENVAEIGAIRALLGDELRELEGVGLLVVEPSITIPPALAQCYVDAFAEDHNLDLEYPEEFEPPAPLADRKAVYQLKIALTGARPPIWRRVLVPSGMPMDQLHRVIQASFDWNDSHLHEFRLGGRRGFSIGPAREPDGSLGGSDLDEAKVLLSAALDTQGAKMIYTYDFGDDWEHEITLEEYHSAAGNPELPTCIAGRGAAPVEDCGGVWGWARMAGDLDLKYFNIDDVNRSYAVMPPLA